MRIIQTIQRIHYTHTVPTAIDLNVQKFCKELSPNQFPMFVTVKPEPYSEKFFCFKNLHHKVIKDGGFVVLGWDITNASNKFLESEYHAVWQSPNGEFIDVTPPQIEGANQILFLIDVERADVMKAQHSHKQNRKFPI